MDLPDESIKPKLGISGENEVFMRHLDVPEGAGEEVADRQRAVKAAKTCAAERLCSEFRRLGGRRKFQAGLPRRRRAARARRWVPEGRRAESRCRGGPARGGRARGGGPLRKVVFEGGSIYKL